MSNQKSEGTKGSKKKAIIWIAVLVMLVGSSYFIYNYLGDANSFVSDMFFKDKTSGEKNITGNDKNTDNNQDINVGDNQNMNIDSNQDINTDNNQDINVGDNQDMNIDSNQDINADNNQDTNVDNNRDANVKEENSNKVKSFDFTLKNFDGDEVSLSDYMGKMVILNFWASWCPPCIAEMPDFNSVNEELTEDDNVVILTVNLTNGYRGETEKAAREFINKNGYTFPVLFDTEGVAAQIYGIRSIPTTYFIDKDGYVVNGISGSIDKDFILKAIETYSK